MSSASSSGRLTPGAWGYDGDAATDAELAQLRALLQARFPDADLKPRSPVPWQSVPLSTPRVPPPGALADICDVSPEARLRHARGRSYLDMVSLQAGDYGTPPDVVATPGDAHQVAAVLDWAAAAGAAVIPFGGGTSVVGGVTPPGGGRTVISLSMEGMTRLLDIDSVSRAAHIQAGARGPQIADHLRPAGLSLRFFPQSYEISTLGGWIATRAAGHFATGPTHIDDLVAAVSAVTPAAGVWQSRRLPASGAGPSPDRLLLGSEGVLGVITDAWVRVRPEPHVRASATVRFPDLISAAVAVRTVVQAGLQPASCRVLDPVEALLAGAGDGTAALLLLGFESPGPPVDEAFDAALGICKDGGGTTASAGGGSGQGEASRWRRTFLRAPYLRDALVSMGVAIETFETSTTWDRLERLISSVIDTTTEALQQVYGDGLVTCRLTHAYPDGAAPYFTAIAPATRGSEATQWREVKAAASDALLAAGGTITHHHAVGRDHRLWYDRQRPDAFAAALAAAKASVDPARVLNPGVLLD